MPEIIKIGRLIRFHPKDVEYWLELQRCKQKPIMQTSLQVLANNRQPTQDEVEHAANMLRSLGNDTLAKLLENSIQLDLEEFRPLVTTNFSAVDDDLQILLVPPGTYEIPAGLLEKTGRYIIGLAVSPANYPVLLIEGDEQGICNTDSADQCILRVCQSYTQLSGVVIDAHEPTVLETYFGDDKQFSDMFFQVEWRGNTDALNIASFTFYHGRAWALAAYGNSYRGRNGLEKGLNSVHEGVLNAVDNTFRPLVSLGQKIDRLLGL